MAAALDPPAGRRGLAKAGVALVVLGLGAAVLSGYVRPSSSTRARRSVAVLGFAPGEDPEVARTADALALMLETELSAREEIRTIPSEIVFRLRGELEGADPEGRARIQRSLGSDLVVMGSCREGPAGVQLDVRMQETATGKVVATFTEKGTVLGDLVARVADRLGEHLGAHAEAGATLGALPSPPEAARLYAQGMQRLWRFDAKGGRDLLQRAAALDPASPLAHSALGDAWSALGYDARARDEAKQARDLAVRLPRPLRLVVEARYHEASRTWASALETSARLFELYPDSPEHGLRLARVQVAAGKGKDALATVAALRKLPPPTPADPRIDLMEARAAEALGDFWTCQASATRAAEKAEGIGAMGGRLLLAEARYQEGKAQWRLGKLDQAIAAADEARRTFDAVGDRAGVARTRGLSEFVLLDQGELTAARAADEEALAINEEIGNDLGVAITLSRIGLVRMQQGDLSGARAMFERSLAKDRELDNRLGVVIQQNMIAVVRMQQGETRGARATFEQCLAFTGQTGDRRGDAVCRSALAEVLMRTGDLAAARQMFEQALDIWRPMGDKAGFAKTMTRLGALLLVQDDPGAARKALDEALAIRTELGTRGALAESRLALANWSLDHGPPAEAEGLARQAAEEFEREGRRDDLALARAVLARSLLARGRLPEARSAVAAALVAAGPSENAEVRVVAALAEVRVLVAAGAREAAGHRLDAALALAERDGLIGLQLEARLVKAALDLAAGRPGARARISALEHEAAQKGYANLASRTRLAAR